MFLKGFAGGSVVLSATRIVAIGMAIIFVMEQNSLADTDNYPVLKAFITERSLEEVKSFLDKSHISLTDALMVASIYGNLAVVKLLLDKGVNVNAANEYGQTPLMSAAGSGYFEVVKLLLDHGAAVDARNKERSTALIEASFGGHLSVVKLLLDKGANVNAKSDRGDTPLSQASDYPEIIKLLKSRGAKE